MACHRRMGFTLIEVLVVIAIIAIVMALVMGGLSAALDASAAAKCKNNLHNLSEALNARAADTGSGYPGTVSTWVNLLQQPYPGLAPIEAALFVCPKDTVPAPPPGYSSYAINGAADQSGKLLLKRGDDGHKILMVEYLKPVANVVGPNPDVWSAQAAFRHRGRMNVLFCDGHVDTYGMADIDPGNTQFLRTLWTPSSMLASQNQ